MPIESYRTGREGMSVFNIRNDDTNDFVSVDGYSRSPIFVNRIDESLWKERWKQEANANNFRYIHDQARFNASTREIGGFSEEEVEAIDVNMVELLGRYACASKKYSEEVSGPYINERKGLIDRTCGGEQL